MFPLLLQECGFSWAPGQCPPHWQGMAAALASQAGLLGLECASPTGAAGGGAFALSHPGLGTVTAHLLPVGERLASPFVTELTLQAACGLMSVHGRASGRARPLGVDYLTVLTAAMTLQAALAAALGQLRGGDFREVYVSPLECGLLSIGQYLAGATAAEEAERLLPGCSDPLLRPPFASADGAVFELETLDSGPWRRFWEAVGIPGEMAGAAWKAFLLRYARAVAPMPGECVDALARLPFARIRELAAAAGLALVPVRSWQQRQDDEDFRKGDGGPWRVRAQALAGAARPAPALPALPLQGLRVIESCRRIQGPLAGHLLALLGAEVIRLEPPGGDPLRAMPPCADGCSVRFDALNHLKTVCEVDIKTEAGRRSIHELCREADVFLHNWAPGKAEELTLDARRLHAVQPGLVYAYAGGWGAAAVPAPGTDFTVQAWSGVAEAIGRAGGLRGGSLFTALDVLGGAIAALGVGAALLRRALGKVGVEVESSLLGSADLLMRSTQPAQALAAGVFPCLDGLIAVDCRTPQQFEAMAMLLDLPSPAATALEQAFGSRPAADWEVALHARGIPASAVAEDLGRLPADRRLYGCLGRRAYSYVNSPWSFP